MSARLLWTPRAQEDLLEIYYFIGLDNPLAADRVFDSIQRRLEALADHPRIGVRRPDIHLSTRMLVEGPYLILYETHPDSDKGRIDSVEIVRIVDGRRHLEHFL